MLEQARRVLKGLTRRLTRRALYEKNDYLSAYSEDTDHRVEQDPYGAVDGLWQQMGQLQFDFLVGQGLRPEQTLLDIGCGTLRGGRHFIRYLNAGKYTGMDISPKALEFARQLVEKEHLSAKDARLILNREKTLQFSDFKNKQFDYLLAQSVFTHLPQQQIKECFQHVRQIMHNQSKFFFTFRSGEASERCGRKGFAYPLEFFMELANVYDYSLEDRSDGYPHPNGQRMLMLTLLPSAGHQAAGPMMAANQDGGSEL